MPITLVLVKMSYTAVVYTCVICYFAVFVTANKSLNDILFNGDFEFFDLTHQFDKNTIYWPNGKKFAFTKKIELFKEDHSWYAANDFEAAEHGGTHLDAPYHFQAKGKRVEDIPIEKLIVPLIIADVSSKVNDDPNFVLHKHHLDYMLNDNFGSPCVIIFKFGWTKFSNDKLKYLGSGPNKTLNFPGLSDEVAEWITSSYKNIVGIGVDTASLDPGSSSDFAAHKLTTKAGLYILENVKLDETIPEYGCTALILPIKIAGGTGAPLRLVAICPKKIPTNFH